MSRKKILWLCSWYPDKTNPFNGDFIQRHARAAALFNDIHVIHVTGDASGKISGKQKEINTSTGLSEHIIYYPSTTSLMGRLISHYSWLFIFRQEVKKYISENGKPDIVHVHIPMKAGLIGRWVKKKYGIPYAVTEHWGIYNDVEVQNYTVRSNIFKRYTRKIFTGAAVFISVSKFLAEGINKLVLKKDYAIIPNATDTDLFFYKENPISAFRFIHVSSMVPLKNAEGILKAFSLLLQWNSDVHLLMLGDTDPAIRKYAEAAGLAEKNISFGGEVPYEKVASEMQQSDCLILFSNIENSPCVIGEALCAGIPVIVSNVGGIPELVDDSNAILVESKNEKQLIEAMQQMINNYSVYDRKKIAERAKSWFSYPVIGKKLDEVYTAMTSDKV